jgi:glutathione S-transferase
VLINLNSAISVELREIRLSNIPQELLRISPKATVPVLHFPDGTLFEQSLDIMNWALSVSDPQQWLTDDSESQQLIRQNDEDFKPLLDAYKYAERFPQLSQLEHRNNAEYFLQHLEHRLVEHAYLIADRQTTADIAIMPFIRQFAGVEPRWFEHCEYAGVRRWLNQQIESDLFKAVMRKYDFWQAGDETVYFGSY